MEKLCNFLEKGSKNWNGKAFVRQPAVRRLLGKTKWLGCSAVLED